MNEKLIRSLSKYQIEKAYEFINDIKKNHNTDNFGQVMEKLYALDGVFFKEISKQKTINLSSGTSQIKTFIPYLNLLTSDLKKHKYYRDYFSPSGSQSLRQTIAVFESLKLRNNNTYEYADVCLTEGATGAISSVFEFFHKKYPHGEIIIPNPTYYLFKFVANHYGIKCKEIISRIKTNLKKGKFIDVQEIIKNINDKTKLIVIVNPNNPTGEIYAKKDLVKIIEIAIKKDIFILSDEVFFDLIFKENQDVIETDVLAYKLDALNKVITVKSISKNRNLPGLRIGYALSKNKELIKNISKIQEERVFFATASNFKTMVMFDCFLQSIKIVKKINSQNTFDKIKEQALNLYSEIGFIKNQNIKNLKKLYFEFENYLIKTNSVYSDYFDFMISVFGDEIIACPDKESGFNTFIKVKDLDSVNIFDFCLNLYLLTGVKIQASPYFGFDQKTWEKSDYGFWMRFTFAQNKKIMKEGIEKLIEFKRLYLSRKSDFLNFNLLF